MKLIIKQTQLDVDSNRRVMETEAIQKNETHPKRQMSWKKILTPKILLFSLLFVNMLIIGESANAQWGVRRQERKLEKLERQAALDEKRAELEARAARNEQHKTRVKQLNNEGWRVNGPRTLEVALLDHYKQDPEGNKTYTAELRNCKTVNLCQRTALTQAQNYYAQRASAHVKGRVGEVLTNQGVPQTDIDKVLAQYGTKVDAEVGKILAESYVLLREVGGVYETQVAFIVDEEKASSLRLDAMKKSLMETKIVGLELDEIFKAVGEDVDLQ